MRSTKIWGWLLAAVGALIALVGLAVMIVLGPDGRFTTGPHAIDTDASAVVTAPSVVRWAGVQVDILVEVPIEKPVFVGVGSTVDVEDYVRTTERVEITRYDTPWDVELRTVEGEPNLPSAPTALDWWIASQAGLGGAAVTVSLPDEPVSVAIVAVGSTNLTGLEVTVAYGVAGGFGRGAGLAVLGLGVVWLGVSVLRGGLWRRDDLEEAEEEVEVFIWVDDDGVEHEIHPDDLDGFEIVEEEVAEVREPLVQPDPEPDPESDTGSEKVVYVWVDDDGVEHEISEDELADFEVVGDDSDDEEGGR